MEFRSILPFVSIEKSARLPLVVPLAGRWRDQRGGTRLWERNGWLTRRGSRGNAAFAVLLFAMVGMIQAAQEPVLRAGAATSNITPEIGFVMRVGSFNTTSVRHIRDELHARVLVLDDGRTRIAFIVCDALMINREIVDEAKKRILEATGIPPQNIIVSATHSHTAPSVRASDARKFVLPLSAYEEFFVGRVLDGVRRAINQMELARVAWGQADLPEHVHNRRWLVADPELRRNPFGGVDQVRMNPPFASRDLIAPAGSTDPEISFLSVQTAAGRPLAVLANYSLHYVGGIRGGDVSADYFGAFAERMTEVLGANEADPPFVAILTNGTSGDINNFTVRKAREQLPDGAKIRIVANAVAEKVLGGMKSLAHTDRARLRVAFVDRELATRRPTPEQIAWARKILNAGAPRTPYHVNESAYAQRTLFMAEYPERIRFPLHAFLVGELAILSVPVEAFAEIGLTLKEKSPFPATFTIGLANGYFGYLPTPRHHELGGYETWLGTNRMKPESSTEMTEALLQLLADLRR